MKSSPIKSKAILLDEIMELQKGEEKLNLSPLQDTYFDF